MPINVKPYRAMVDKIDTRLAATGDHLTDDVLALVDIAMPPGRQLEALAQRLRETIYGYVRESRRHVRDCADAYVEAEGLQTPWAAIGLTKREHEVDSDG